VARSRALFKEAHDAEGESEEACDGGDAANHASEASGPPALRDTETEEDNHGAGASD
jgi:hypothetical protein